MGLRVLPLVAAGAFAIYEALLCSYHAEQATVEAQKLIEALKARDEAVRQWQQTQERIHEDQMKILKRIEALE